MYPSSSSSSHQQSTTNNSSSTNPNLMRYDSAPTALLSNTVDSFLGQGQGQGQGHGNQQHQFFSCVNNDSKLRLSGEPSTRNTLSLLHQGPYGGGTMDSAPKTTSSVGLFRHSSSPAGVLSHLASENGFPATKGFDVNYNGQGGSMRGDHHHHHHHNHHMPSRLGPQLSFTRNDLNSLSQISEVNESVLQGINDERKRSIASQSRPNTSGFSLSSWDDSHNNSFVISTSSSKRGKSVSDDFLNGLSTQQAMELDMVTMDRLLHVPQDSVPCKIRAKRGCATHPRSIAERERRTRISGKLKKLQELVPNMDKQTSYADMLDLAVKHIKGLQGQIEKLNNDFKHCTCGCKPNV